MDVAERRMPGRCAVDATYRIEQAEQTIRKRSDNQIDRTRILEVRIHLPPAKSLLRTVSGGALLRRHSTWSNSCPKWTSARRELLTQCYHPLNQKRRGTFT